LKSIDDWRDEECHLNNPNAKALNMIFAAIRPKEFKFISTCKTAKDAWEKLQMVFEETNTFRMSKL
jgi:hypothetical protein